MTTKPHATATSIHLGASVSPVDPGVQGGRKLWVDTSSGPPFQLKVRNAGDTGWDLVGLISDVESLTVENLTDVQVSGLTDGQVLKWNAGAAKWENAAESGGGGGSFPDFTSSGSPEGVQTAAVGKSYVDTTNGALYFKASGAGNTGWQGFGVSATNGFSIQGNDPAAVGLHIIGAAGQTADTVLIEGDATGYPTTALLEIKAGLGQATVLYVPLFQITNEAGFRLLTVNSEGSLYLQAADPGANILTVGGAVGQTAPIANFSSANRAVWVDKDGYLSLINANAAPADANLYGNELSFWFDSANGASKLMVKAKSADGTVVTGALPLS